MLGATLSGYSSILEHAYDVPSLSSSVDLLNIMAYDLKGFWDKETGHHAQLQQDGSGKTVVSLKLSFFFI